MHYSITKIRNGCWQFKTNKGVKTLHSTKQGAINMANSHLRFHGLPENAGCEYCDGEGVIATDVFDPDSGQNMRGVGSQKCICLIQK